MFDGSLLLDHAIRILELVLVVGLVDLIAFCVRRTW